MREIKFRGLRTDGKGWAYGSLLKLNGKFYIYEGEYGDLDDLDFGHGFIEVMCGTVGQFTGLTDKNRVEIYEGDVIKDKSGVSDVVCYDEIAYNLMIAYASAPDGKCTNFFGSNNPLSGIEVIGNIHEHQELLKQEQ